MTSTDEPVAHHEIDLDDVASSTGKESTANAESSATSFGGSPSPSPRASKLKTKSLQDEALSADQLESLYEHLPEDSTALKAIVGTMRLEISRRDKTIEHLSAEMDQVKASHSVVLQRSAEWQDELETLRWKVPKLEQELQQEKAAREAESDRVKDLRLRAEESRRAIMRLQGEQQDARAKAKAENRRSMGPGSLAGWNPPASLRDEQEEAEKRKSKRASLAFGPNAGLAIAAAGRPGGHRRTASGGRSASRTGDEDQDEPLSPTLPGLRGLRLSGAPSGAVGSSSLLAPGLPGDDDASSNAGSRRSSFQSTSRRSPRVTPTELPEPSELAPTGSLLGGARLAIPGTSASRTSLTASPALSQGALSSASPILEDAEDDENHSAGPNGVNAELKAKEVEIERLTREMKEMRHRMEEALEARQASEACLKALREFIANHDAAADAEEGVDQIGDLSTDTAAPMRSNSKRTSVGAGLLRGVKLPPLPTDADGDEPASPAKPAASGWSMKIPQLIRKGTSSSTGASSANVPTPSDEMGNAPPMDLSASPKKDASGAASAIGGSLASFGNLLSRNSISMANSPFAGFGEAKKAPGSASSPPLDAPAAVAEATSPPLASNGFKGFNWFKKGAEATPAAAEGGAPNAVATAAVEEKVMSPPFRSLDHDQLAITRQSVAASPEIKAKAELTPLGSQETVPKRPAEPQLSYRAQKALEKTAGVSDESVFVPAAFD